MAKHGAQQEAQTQTQQTPKRNKQPGEKPRGRHKVDWEAVERDYRTGHFTLRELEAKHGVSYAQISRKSKEHAWTKDLREVIKQATDAALLRETVTEAQKDVTETVLVAAEVNKKVILAHRSGLQALTNVKRTLLAQIEQAAGLLPDLEEVVEMVRKPDDNGVDRANDALRKAMSRSALVDDLKKLADVDEKIRKGEREAFGLDEEVEPFGASGAAQLSDAQRAARLAALVAKAAQRKEEGGDAS